MRGSPSFFLNAPGTGQYDTHQKRQAMDQRKISDAVRSIFTEHFGIGPGRFEWELPLEELDERFKHLGNLVFLEQLLRKEFQKEVLVLENICTAFHTPADILELVANNELKGRGNK